MSDRSIDRSIDACVRACVRAPLTGACGHLFLRGEQVRAATVIGSLSGAESLR